MSYVKIGAEPVTAGACTCQTESIVTFLLHRRGRAHVALAVLIALTLLAGAGCGSGGDEGDGPLALTERDDAGDVLDMRAVERLDDDEWDEATIESLTTDGQPGLDLRGAGLAVKDRTLRLDVETEGPIRTGTFGLTASTKASCGSAQLTVSIHVREGGTTVKATDLPHGRGRRVEATVKVDGEHLTLSLPLLTSARFEDWTVSSTDAASSRLERSRYGDYVPDQVIEGAYFTRGTGTPNYAGTFGDEPCGPPDPPLLAH
ncbi:hypothetical protein Q5424_27070 [Conexibacter sp. JD483]|uniref:hypothetical protein n=1 Tax=unclassified Conexibacter TaxID=2627773 RepID=UPI0027200B48|nr:MULTISPECIES: hypothetical protein [unclassified Conexibacter]MDO8187543.1 hypothetical protein [Conexibacter sp. CPCC 205706]MDO8199214.1 hypothetical protein [Conexibacter sp. CPCC 205762]MDR9372792.1 hypothetical protein [Conexibacter sp. JD483]